MRTIPQSDVTILPTSPQTITARDSKRKADSFLRLTFGAQGLLLFSAVVMFFYWFIWLPQFPQGGVLGKAACDYILAMIPNLLLLALLILNARCTAGLGMVLAAFVTTLTAVQTDSVLFFGGAIVGLWRSTAYIWIFSLVCLAIANLYSFDNVIATLRLIKMPFQHILVQVPLVVAGLALSWFGISFLFCGFIFSGLGDQNPGGYAPEEDYAARRAWGLKEMPRYFAYVDKWVRKSELVAGDIGKVTEVAPIGWPNNFITFFTDGPSVSMNLQVVGERGEGILTLPHVYLTNYPTKQFEIDATSTWNCDGNTTSIVSSGKSWINEKGFGQQHLQVLSAATQANHDRVIQACHSLEQSLPSQYGEIDRRKWGRELHCGIFLGLPPSDRQALLLLLGDSHATVGNTEDAVGCYLDAATISFNALAEFPWRRNCSRAEIDPALVTREIEKANEALIKAHRLAPESKTLKKLARERAMLAYRNHNGHLLDRTWDLSDAQLQDRTIAELRDLYSIPIIFAKKSPWLRQELGRMRFRCKTDAGNHLFINEEDRYQALVTLEVCGSTGVYGSFEMKVYETPELSDAIDLYAPVPRFPLQNYRGKGLTWRPQTGKRVRLDSKTLMPKKKSLKKKTARPL